MREVAFWQSNGWCIGGISHVLSQSTHPLTYLKDAMLDMKMILEFNNTHNLLHLLILWFIAVRGTPKFQYSDSVTL